MERRNRCEDARDTGSSEQVKGAIKGLEEGIKEIKRAASVSQASTDVRRRMGVRHGRDTGRGSGRVTEDREMEDGMEDAEDSDGGEVDDRIRLTVNDNTVEGDESSLLPTSFKWAKANTRAICTEWHFGNRG